MKEINRLVLIGVLKRQSLSQWASPTFIIPKKDVTVCGPYLTLGSSINRLSEQYYCDMWAKHSEMLAPLSDLVGECGETKTTRKKQV
jgi:hypothetical protein